MPQNRTVSVFSLFSVRKLITCLIFEMPYFRIDIGSNASNVSKMGHFRKNEQSKSGAFQEKNTWSDFEQKKREKLKLFDFGAFQEKLHMSSRAKYLLHKLFGAFHDTPRMSNASSMHEIGIEIIVFQIEWVINAQSAVSTDQLVWNHSVSKSENSNLTFAWVLFAYVYL